jgi:hypothetical protein
MTEKELFSNLSSIPSVGGRVYPVTAPQDIDAPYITYHSVYEGYDQCMSGEIYSNTVRMQVDIWSGSYAESKDIKEDVISRIVTMKGADISVQDLYDHQARLYRQLIDFKIKG